MWLCRTIDGLRDSVRRVKRLYPFYIDAWVVLPDTDDFPVRPRLLKLLFARGLPRSEWLADGYVHRHKAACRDSQLLAGSSLSVGRSNQSLEGYRHQISINFNQARI